MPTYEYQCGHCGRFQIAQRITEPALAVCPTCGQPVQRLISNNVGIIFKGTGFYCTDHRSKSSRQESGGETRKTAADNSGTPAQAEQGTCKSGKAETAPAAAKE